MLTLAEQGDISLLRPTSTRHAPLRDGDSWTGQLTTLTGRPHRLMEECIKDFGELCSNIQESGWSSAIETEISSHMLNMQCQPLLMDNFRRFVVIKAACDGNHSWDSGVSQ
jgi:hypothetical protein